MNERDFSEGYSVNLFSRKGSAALRQVKKEGFVFDGSRIVFFDEYFGPVLCNLEYPVHPELANDSNIREILVKPVISNIRKDFDSSRDSLDKFLPFIQNDSFGSFSYARYPREDQGYRVYDSFKRKVPLAEVLLEKVPGNLDTLTKDQYSGLLNIVGLLGITWEDVVKLRKVNSQKFSSNIEVYFRDGCKDILHLINYVDQDEKGRYYVAGKSLQEGAERLFKLNEEVVNFELMINP